MLPNIRIVQILLLALYLVPPSAYSSAFSAEEQKEHCDALSNLAGGERRPGYVAVISRTAGESAAWAHKLPIPFVVYSYAGNSPYSVKGLKGAPSSAYVSFILDHFTCLPRNMLFLHASAAQTNGFHSLDPASSSALVNIAVLDKGYLPLGHLAGSPEATADLHPSSEAFSSAAAAFTHRAAFVSDAEGRVGCECYIMRKLLSGIPGVSGSLGHDAFAPVQCERAYSWVPGNSFWTTNRRVQQRPYAFWAAALNLLFEDEEFKSEDEPGKKTNFAAKCFETIWHFMLGQPLYHFQPTFEAFEDLPLVTYSQRCLEANATCASAVAALHTKKAPTAMSHSTIPHPHSSSNSGGIQRQPLCAASHGEMDGEDIGVTTWSGYSVEQRDHSCCAKCNAVAGCEFWVRSTKTNDCWLRRHFKGFVNVPDRRGSFVERAREASS